MGFANMVSASVKNIEKGYIPFNSKAFAYAEGTIVSSVLECDMLVEDPTMIVPEGTVSTLMYAGCSKDSSGKLEIAVKTDFGDLDGISDRLKLDYSIGLGTSFNEDVIINGYEGAAREKPIGSINLISGSTHFWLSDFPDAEKNTNLNSKSNKTDIYTFVVENVPESMVGTAAEVTVAAAASVDGCFDGPGADVMELYSGSMTAKLGVYQNPDTVYIDKKFGTGIPGWGITRFNDIHDAVNAAAHKGTVNIAKGIYYLTDFTSGHNRLVINKELAVKGSGMDETTLFVYAPTTSSGPIYIDNIMEFSMADLTVDGGNRSFDNGIHAKSGNISIDRVKIKNVNNNIHGCGIKIENNSSFPEMLKVNGCIFENISEYGILVFGAKADIGTLSPNTFMGGCTTYSKESDSQSAIYISKGEDVVIRNNIINGYKKPDSAGVYIDSGTVSIGNNVITDCTVDYKGAYTTYE